ncbi:hypothetical protein R3P38DRAFT_2809715 [Favolaschia claudopus]|uniref:LAGLIDADG homing endonuclease n=1 Tax=Favolaschia claudopus TaxID=2862362 RepID=A0AAV9ZDG5_9AGAR
MGLKPSTSATETFLGWMGGFTAAADSRTSAPCVIGNPFTPASISDVLEVAVAFTGHTNTKPSKRKDGVKDTKLRIELGLEEDEFNNQYYRILILLHSSPPWAFIDYWVIKLSAGK